MSSRYKNKYFLRRYGLIKLVIVGILFGLLLFVMRTIFQNPGSIVNINITDSEEGSNNGNPATKPSAFINNFEFSGLNSKKDKFHLTGKRAQEHGEEIDIFLPEVSYIEYEGFKYNANSEAAIFNTKSTVVSFETPVTIIRDDDIEMNADSLTFNLKSRNLYSTNIFIKGKTFSINANEMKHLNNLQSIQFSGNIHIISEDN